MPADTITPAAPASPSPETKEKRATPRRKQAKTLLRHCGSSLFVFVLLYNLLFKVAVAPLGRLVWTGAVRLSGRGFFLMGSSAKDLFASPLLLVVGALLGIGYAFWALYEIAGILLCLDAGTRSESIPLPVLLKTALSRLLPVLLPKNLPLLLFAGVIIPFTDFVMVSGFISDLSIPAYIMEVVVERPLYLTAFLLVGVVLIFWTVQWLFVFHRFLIEREDLPTAARHSIRLIKGRRIKSLAGLIFYRLRVWIVYGLYALVGVLVYMIALFFLQDYLPSALGSAQLTLVYLLEPLFGFICHCFVTFAQWAYVTVLYRELRPTLQGEPPAAPLPRRRFYLRLMPLLIASLFILTGAVGTMFFLLAGQSSEFMQLLLDNHVAVTAHRGHSASAPENTLPAFQAAIDSGVVDYAELDVQQTADGVVVLTHDTNLKRCTGRDVNVYELSYEELRTLDASLGYHGEGDFTGTRIPTLDEVIKLCKGKIKLNIEIKQNGHAPALEAEVVRIIRDNGFDGECVVTSLNYDSLEKVKALAPELRCGYILAVGVGQYYDLPAADFFSVETTFVTKNMVNQLHLRGKEVHSWTVDEADDAVRLIRMGVDNLITGQPEMVHTQLVMLAENYRELQTLPGLRGALHYITAEAEEALPATPETAAPSPAPGQTKLDALLERA